MTHKHHLSRLGDVKAVGAIPARHDARVAATGAVEELCQEIHQGIRLAPDMKFACNFLVHVLLFSFVFQSRLSIALLIP